MTFVNIETKLRYIEASRQTLLSMAVAGVADAQGLHATLTDAEESIGYLLELVENLRQGLIVRRWIAIADSEELNQLGAPRCSELHARYGRCQREAGHPSKHVSDVGADGPDDPGYSWTAE